MLPELRPWLAALAALVVLQGAAHLATPPTVSLSEAVHHVGARVLVAGRIRDLHTAPGWARADVTDGAAVLPVTASGPHVPPLEVGDELRVAGVVELRGPAVELQSRGVDVAVLATPGAVTPLAAVGGDPARYAGTPLAAAGNVSGTAGAWALDDGGVSLTLKLPAGPSPYPGEAVGARGVLRYDPAALAYHLEVATWWPS